MSRLLIPFAAVLCLAAGPAMAAITVNSTAGNFFNGVGSVPETFEYNNADSLPGADLFAFGTPATAAGKSQLRFSSAGPLATSVNTQFDLGTLSYTNTGIYGNATGVSLQLTSSITGDSGSFSIPFLFQLAIDNTPNSPPCPYSPSTVNCSDAVFFSVLSGTGTFMDGDTTYTLFIDGFRDSGGNQTAMFIGQENTVTTATVIGRFAAFTPAAVPEPATWGMMIAGFGLVGGAMRRRASVAYA